VFDAIPLFFESASCKQSSLFPTLIAKKDFFFFFYKKGLTINHYNEKEKRMYGKNELTPFFFLDIYFLSIMKEHTNKIAHELSVKWKSTLDLSNKANNKS
jgi:hypothetical protein